MRTVIVSGDPLTVEDVVDVALGGARAELGPDVPARMRASRTVVTAAIAGDAPVYGVNTGFGALADTRVGEQDLATLQRAIVLSHAGGHRRAAERRDGARDPPAAGQDAGGRLLGCPADLPARLIELLNLGLLPVVPGKGSVGASGDLAQLAHLAQPLIGEGRLRGPGDDRRRAARPPRCSPSTASSRSCWPRRRACRWSTAPSRCRRCWPSRCTTRDSWSRRPTSPARSRSRRCCAPTGPTTSGSR